MLIIFAVLQQREFWVKVHLLLGEEVELLGAGEEGELLGVKGWNFFEQKVDLLEAKKWSLVG